ncbi:MAG: hypothetical protein N2Z73_00500 [Endomicrobia bacterium]|nr:hypothetical protein [Endomicrobiia bacterium]
MKQILRLIPILIIILTTYCVVFATEETIIKITPFVAGKCINTTWTPDPNQYCNNTEITQTSNCGVKRKITGTKIPSWTPDPNTKYECETFTQTDGCGNSRQINGTIPVTWIPNPNTKRQCETFTQTNNCNQTRQAQGNLPDIWTPDPSTVWENDTFTQTNTCGQTRTAIGTKPNTITEIRIRLRLRNSFGEEDLATVIINPNTKQYNNTIYLNQLVRDQYNGYFYLSPEFGYPYSPFQKTYKCAKTGSTQYQINNLLFYGTWNAQLQGYENAYSNINISCQ